MFEMIISTGKIWWQTTVPGDAIPSSSGDSTSTLLIRGGIFLLILLVFVFVCGYAWRKVPALRALIPEFKPGQSSLEARLQEKREQEAAAQAEAERNPPKPVNSTAIAPPNLNKRPSLNNLTPLGTVPKSEPNSVTIISQAFSSDKRVEEAIADGTPGAVVRAASDLDGSIHHAPILIVQREDEQPDA